MYYSKFNARLCEIILAGDETGLAHLHLNTGEGTRRFSVLPEWELNRQFFAATKAQILEYLEGKRKQFDVAINPRGTDFQKKVWEALCRIPYGRLTTYGDIARTLGNHKAARAVGSANGKNPIPLIIPCHRVVGADGSLTGFGHGISLKEELIRLEREAAG